MSCLDTKYNYVYTTDLILKTLNNIKWQKQDVQLELI